VEKLGPEIPSNLITA